MESLTEKLTELKGNLASLYNNDANILIDRSFSWLYDSYTARIVLEYAGRKKRRTISANNFIFNFARIIEASYPDHLITAITLLIYKKAIYRVNIDDYLDDYVVLRHSVDRGMQVKLHDKLQDYHDYNQYGENCCVCCFTCWNLSALCAIWFLIYTLTDGEDVVSESCGIAMVVTGVLCAMYCFAMLVFCHRADRIQDNYGFNSLCADGCAKLADLIFHIAAARTVIRAVGQYILIKQHLEYLPEVIADEILLYSIGDVKTAMCCYFNLPQQQKLFNYFNDLQAATNIAADDCAIVKDDVRMVLLS